MSVFDDIIEVSAVLIRDAPEAAARLRIRAAKNRGAEGVVLDLDGAPLGSWSAPLPLDEQAQRDLAAYGRRALTAVWPDKWFIRAELIDGAGSAIPGPYGSRAIAVTPLRRPIMDVRPVLSSTNLEAAAGMLRPPADPQPTPTRPIIIEHPLDGHLTSSASTSSTSSASTSSTSSASTSRTDIDVAGLVGALMVMADAAAARNVEQQAASAVILERASSALEKAADAFSSLITARDALVVEQSRALQAVAVAAVTANGHAAGASASAVGPALGMMQSVHEKSAARTDEAMIAIIRANARADEAERAALVSAAGGDSPELVEARLHADMAAKGLDLLGEIMRGGGPANAPGLRAVLHGIAVGDPKISGGVKAVLDELSSEQRAALAAWLGSAMSGTA